MLVRARLMNRDHTFGYTSVDEKTRVVHYRDSVFIYESANERVTERGRIVFYTFKEVSTAMEFKQNLDEEF